MKKGVLKTVFLLGLAVLYSKNGFSQYTVQHQPPTVLDRTVDNTLQFFVPGVLETDVSEALLFYRFDGDPGYSQREIFYVNGAFTTSFGPDELSGTGLEYYFQLTLRNSDQDLFYPETLPSENPIEVQIVDGAPQEQLKRAEGIEYTILSPRPGNGLALNDVYVGISLFYDEETLDPGEFRLYVDDVDVTAEADTSNYFISYVPKGLKMGTHSIRLDYVTATESLNVTGWEFRVVDPKKASYSGLAPRLIPAGRVELTARNQVISGDINNAFTGRTYMSGAKGLFKYSLNAYITSQESNRLQPQNRYGLSMAFGKWWSLDAGHIYPNMSRFTISGRRIFGVNTSVHLLWEGLNFQFIYGEINRKVTNRYNPIEVDTVFSTAVPDSILDKNYTLGFQSAGRGTFRRKVIGGRIGLGNPKKFQFGFQAMKVEDDTTSLFNVVNFRDVLEGSSDLYTHLSMADQNRLIANPDLLQIQGGTVRPKGNFVAGADLRFSFDDNKIRFNTETVASALNDNIYGGPLDSLAAADLGFEDIDQSELDILEQLSWLIIINENVNVLPIRFKDFNTDSSSTEVFFPTSVLGSNTELSFNYPRNRLSVQYRWVGPDFVSLANSTIRKDIAGFTVSDRFRLLQNQLYVTLGFEALNDNVANTKNATTDTYSYRTNVSWFPIKEVLPRVSAGFRYRSRDNSVNRYNPFVEMVTGSQNVAVQNVRITSDGDTLITPTPRLNSTLNMNFSVTQQVRFLDIVHDATISLSTLDTKDEVFEFGDVKNSSLSLNITSRFETLPLRTQLGSTINHTESGNGLLDIDIFGMYAGGSYFLLDGKLNINGRLAFTNNITRSRSLTVVDGGDTDIYNDYFELTAAANRNKFSTYVLVAGAEYKFDNHHSFIFDSNFTNVTGENSLNDRIVQFRYIYRF